MIPLKQTASTMIQRFIFLQWRAFRRSPAFGSSVLYKILSVFGILYFTAVFGLLGVGAFYLVEEELGVDPLPFVNDYLIYGTSFWVVMRYFLQKMPILNIQPLMLLPIKSSRIVHYVLGRTMFSFFNIGNAFFFIPFSLVLLNEGYPILQVFSWHVALIAIVYCTNFINIMVNDRDIWFYGFAGVLVTLAALQRFEIFDITQLTGPVFYAFFEQPLLALIPWVLLLAMYRYTYSYFARRMYLDAAMQIPKSEAQYVRLDWLNRLGRTAIFMKNDIKLIMRNKRSKTTVIMSVVFLFYGLLFFTGAAYESAAWKIFAGIFVSGGFLFTFGQYVPSWDSAYYPLMMSQNISYREYLEAKWTLIVAATFVSTILSSFYLFFGWEAYAAVLAGAVYNMGVNAHLVLLSGAYIKTPIDLASNNKPFGDKQSFNVKTLMLSLPKLVLPMLVFALGHWLVGAWAGYVSVAFVGLLGYFLKDKVFHQIERLYKSEKYSTLNAYKQKT